MKYILPVVPDILYHGTNAQFGCFDPAFLGSNKEEDNAVHGFYFVDQYVFAKRFGKRVIRVRLNITKLLDLTILGIKNNEAQASLLCETFFDEKLPAKAALKMIKSEIGLGEIAGAFETVNSEFANQLFREHGYDGIVFSYDIKELQFVPFDTHQITIL